MVERGKEKVSCRNMRRDHRATVVDMGNGNELLVRSALEARWAIFFNTIGLKFQYEPREVKYYTPDFFVDGLGYIEIKPTIRLLGSESERKISRFCKEHPALKLYCFIGEKVSFETVALFESDKIYAPTFTHLVQAIIPIRDPKLLNRFETHCDAINYAFKTANQFKLNHWVRVGAYLPEVIESLSKPAA